MTATLSRRILYNFPIQRLFTQSLHLKKIPKYYIDFVIYFIMIIVNLTLISTELITKRSFFDEILLLDKKDFHSVLFTIANN